MNDIGTDNPKSAWIVLVVLLAIGLAGYLIWTAVNVTTTSPVHVEEPAPQ